MNWVETIALLKEAGYTQSQIATHCKCAQNTISDLATGTTKSTSFATGQALQRLTVKAKRKLARRKQPA